MANGLGDNHDRHQRMELSSGYANLPREHPRPSVITSGRFPKQYVSCARGPCGHGEVNTHLLLAPEELPQCPHPRLRWREGL